MAPSSGRLRKTLQHRYNQASHLLRVHTTLDELQLIVDTGAIHACQPLRAFISSHRSKCL